jgi:hypothetical protein
MEDFLSEVTEEMIEGTPATNPANLKKKRDFLRKEQTEILKKIK